MDYYFGNPNSNPNYAPSPSEFMLSDYILLDEAADHQECWSQSTESSENKAATSDATTNGGFGGATSSNNNSNIKYCKNKSKRNKEGEASCQRVTFRTRSELEIMDDGYKWRKYGKKSVKNSPNPRNYYKCSSEGCGVKKRVERDGEDPSYVLTTYDGVHTHESPSSTSYYTHHISFNVHSNEYCSHLHPSANSSSSNSFPQN